MTLGVLLAALVIACLFAQSCQTTDQDKVIVPGTLPPHPRLFLNKKEIKDLKAWVDREEWLRKYVDEFVEGCVKDAETPELPTTESGEGDNPRIAKKARDFSLAYVLSGRQELAEAVAKILRAYVEAYPQYGVALMKGRATSSALGEAEWGRNIACAYDLIYNSGALSDADKHAIADDVLRPCGEVLRDCNHHFRSNWRAAAISGVGVIGFCIDDRDLLDEALNGYRDASGELIRDGFVQHLAWSLLADGVFYERSMGYHHFSMHSYVYLLEAARHSNLDLWNYQTMGSYRDAGADIERAFGETGMKNIRAMLDAPFYYAFSDGSMANVANSGKDRLDRQWYYEAAWRKFHDPKYAWLVNPHKGELPINSPDELFWMSPDMPEGEFDLTKDTKIGVTGRYVNGCTLLPNGGYTILRESTDKDAVNVMMTYGKYGSGHSHPDELSIVVCANGRHTIFDKGHIGYGHAQFLGWAKQTIGHNTVTVDEVAQYPQGKSEDPWQTDWGGKPARGRPIFFHASEELKAFRADCDSGYEGVLLDRTIALVGPVLVDFYRCRSDEEHQYDFSVNIDGELSDCSAALGKARHGPLSEALGYKSITKVRRAPLTGQTELTYLDSDGESRVYLNLLSPTDAELITGRSNEAPAKFFGAPLIPWLIMVLIGALLALGSLIKIPGVGPTILGLGLSLVILGGLIIAFLLFGLIGGRGPLIIHPTAVAKGKDIKSASILIVRSRAKATDFVEVMSFGEEGSKVTSCRLDDVPEGVLGVEVSQSDGTKNIVLSAESSGTFEYAGVRITGQLALLRIKADGTTELVDTVE